MTVCKRHSIGKRLLERTIKANFQYITFSSLYTYVSALKMLAATATSFNVIQGSNTLHGRGHQTLNL